MLLTRRDSFKRGPVDCIVESHPCQLLREKDNTRVCFKKGYACYIRGILGIRLSIIIMSKIIVEGPRNIYRGHTKKHINQVLCRFQRLRAYLPERSPPPRLPGRERLLFIHSQLQHVRGDLTNRQGRGWELVFVQFLLPDFPIDICPLLGPCPATSGFIICKIEVSKRGGVVVRVLHPPETDAGVDDFGGPDVVEFRDVDWRTGEYAHGRTEESRVPRLCLWLCIRDDLRLGDETASTRATVCFRADRTPGDKDVLAGGARS